MADRLSDEAFLPCLLDFLTDDQPDKKTEPARNLFRTASEFRNTVLQNLNWLLNTPSHNQTETFEDFPEVEKSVLNFGTRDLCGKTVGDLDIGLLERSLLTAIANFEPRIMRAGLTVKAVSDTSAINPTTIGFEIRGQIWGNPYPEAFILKTLIDLETGSTSITQ
jgi:type VI secretion system protein ImpF